MRPQLYVCCPRCSLVGPPESLDYTIGVLGENIDWEQPVAWQCAQCGHEADITEGDVLPEESSCTCGTCGRAVECPGDAIRVACMGCGSTGPGPAAADPEVAAHLRAVVGLHAIELRVRAALPDP